MERRQGEQAKPMSVKRYTPAGSGVARTDPKGEYVHYSDYIDLKSQPDSLTAYLYAERLEKDDIKKLKEWKVGAELLLKNYASIVFGKDEQINKLINENKSLKSEVNRIKSIEVTNKKE